MPKNFGPSRVPIPTGFTDHTVGEKIYRPEAGQVLPDRARVLDWTTRIARSVGQNAE
jgi:hypothetical protein